MNNKMQIQISGGGSAVIGVASQGDCGTVEGNALIPSTNIGKRFEETTTKISSMASKLGTNPAELNDVLALLSILNLQAKEPSQNISEGKGILDTVRENFSWAYPAIKDFTRAIWPALLTAIGS
jgi:hypothetical protein